MCSLAKRIAHYPGASVGLKCPLSSQWFTLPVRCVRSLSPGRNNPLITLIMQHYRPICQLWRGSPNRPRAERRPLMHPALQPLKPCNTRSLWHLPSKTPASSLSSPLPPTTLFMFLTFPIRIESSYQYHTVRWPWLMLGVYSAVPHGAVQGYENKSCWMQKQVRMRRSTGCA